MSAWEAQHKAAKAELRRGQKEQALTLYLELLAHVDAPAAAYDVWVAEAGRAADELSDPRPAAYLALYHEDLLAVRRLLPADRFPFEHAHALVLDRRPDREPARPARLFEQAERPVLAARVYAAAGDRVNAARCYERLLEGGDLTPYEQALLHFQLAVLSKGQGLPLRGIVPERESRRHAAAAQQLLESLADACEEAGEFERALDCYRLYIQLGETLGSFENIVEGYVNGLRILKDERQSLDALDLYEKLIDRCRAHGEYHLAAAQCKEAADYVARVGLLPSWAAAYRRAAATDLVGAARHNQERGGQVQISESALLQAASACNDLFDWEGLTLAFEKLAALPLPAPQKRRYERLAAKRPAAAPQESEPAAPAGSLEPYVAQPQAQPPVWDLDLVEWQSGGDPTAVCLALVGDRSRPQLTRRHALLVLLHAALPLSSSRSFTQDVLTKQRRLVEGLAGLRCYEALRPLERLFDEAGPPEEKGGPQKEDPAPDRAPWQQARVTQNLGNPTPAAALRRTILQALPRLPFRRAVTLLIRGLADPRPGVYAASLDGLAEMHFPEAVRELIRLYRAHPVLEVRRAALKALGRSRDPRARELLEDIRAHEAEPLRSDAALLLQAPFSDATRPG
jgi:tetratricopeptide (TPR) repeat protein